MQHAIINFFHKLECCLGWASSVLRHTVEVTIVAQGILNPYDCQRMMREADLLFHRAQGRQKSPEFRHQQDQYFIARFSVHQVGFSICQSRLIISWVLLGFSSSSLLEKNLISWFDPFLRETCVLHLAVAVDLLNPLDWSLEAFSNITEQKSSILRKKLSILWPQDTSPSRMTRRCSVKKLG